ncbi:hypothetical protein [Streptoalloteichus tenebrarius]|nr:hypothetical protein [Streptoalloteichus tenebrarius]BFF02827.1 hypothetical protein GCM10020241_45020 [Streptoalloteichus tenebrarius]
MTEPTGSGPRSAPYPPPDPFQRQPPPKPTGLPSSVRQTTLATRAPSDLPGVWFDAALDLTWQMLPDGDQRHGRPEDLVRGYAYEILAQVTRAHSVTAVTAAQTEANRQLGWVREVEGVVSMRGSVELSVTPACAQAAEEHERLRRDREVSRLRRELEAEEVDHLRTVAFDQVTSARIWWVRQHPERIREIAELDGVFARLCGEEPGQPVEVTPVASVSSSEERRPDSAGWRTLERLAAVLDQLDDSSRERLWELAVHVVDNLGRTLADERRSPVAAPDAPLLDAVPGTRPPGRQEHDLPPAQANGSAPVG